MNGRFTLCATLCDFMDVAKAFIWTRMNSPTRDRTDRLAASVKAKFRYAIQSPTWSQTCACVSCACVAGRSKAGRKPTANRSATRFELSRHLEPVCDLLSTQKSRRNLPETWSKSGSATRSATWIAYWNSAFTIPYDGRIFNAR